MNLWSTSRVLPWKSKLVFPLIISIRQTWSVPKRAPFPSITMKPNLLSSASSAVRASVFIGDDYIKALALFWIAHYVFTRKNYTKYIVGPTCMELVVAKVERSVDGFERLKVNVNLMSFDRLNIRLLTRSWQQPSIFHCSSPFSKTKWQVQTKWQVLTSRASISSNFQCKKAPQLRLLLIWLPTRRATLYNWMSTIYTC